MQSSTRFPNVSIALSMDSIDLFLTSSVEVPVAFFSMGTFLGVFVGVLSSLFHLNFRATSIGVA